MPDTRPDTQLPGSGSDCCEALIPTKDPYHNVKKCIGRLDSIKKSFTLTTGETPSTNPHTLEEQWTELN